MADAETPDGGIDERSPGRFRGVASDEDVALSDAGLPGRRMRRPMAVTEGGEELLDRTGGTDRTPPRGADDLGARGGPRVRGGASGGEDANQDDNLSEWSRTTP
jgi:hypothetical protein